MAKSSELTAARRNKKNEFYTAMTDIEKECVHYRGFFKGKTVYCNCDNPKESNFFKYFSMNFEFLGLKRLIATCYNHEGHGSIYIYDGDRNGNKVVDNEEIAITELEGDGDFRSPECIEYLKQADVVVTNPPFSLEKEFIQQLIDYDKRFLIIGNINIITSKSVFPIVKDGRMWLGASIHSGDREFRVPDDYPLEAAGYRVDEEGNKYIRVKGVRWFTNIDYGSRYEDLLLVSKYDAALYPKYDGYDAINVNKTQDIPSDYQGVMGVPITFLDKWNPNQFEILGLDDHRVQWAGKAPSVNGKQMYRRLIIRRK